MANPLQEQLIKAGLASKQQVHNAKKDKSKQKKQQGSKKQKVDETKLKAQQAAKEKAERDRELNKRKEEEARKKAISAEINDLIIKNALKRSDDYEIAYNFEHRGKVKRIYVNEELKQRIINGELGIARIEGRYELVPKLIAEKILQRNEKRIVLFTEEEKREDENDPYAEFKIPDDLTW